MTVDAGEKAPQPINSAQTRDFANRILLPVADRHSGGREWLTYSLDHEVYDGDIRHRMHFSAEYDPDIDAYDYGVMLASVQPIDEEWDPEFVRKVLQLPMDGDTDGDRDEEDTMVLPIGLLDEATITDEEDIEGFASMEHDFSFHVPRWRGSCWSKKTMTVTFLDEDGDGIDSEVAYHNQTFSDETPAEDIERLFRFGETVLDIAVYEEELSVVTVPDLQRILKAFQSSGLVRNTCKVLSSRVL